MPLSYLDFHCGSNVSVPPPCRFLFKFPLAVKSYLAQNPLNFGDESIRSMMAYLYWACVQDNPIDSGKIRSGFQTICDRVAHLRYHGIDDVFEVVDSLCREHEEAGFYEGFRASAMLMAELSEKEA